MRTYEVSEHEVMNCPAVPGTNTWRPVPHGEIIRNLEAALIKYDLEVIRKNYNMTLNQRNVFAVWDLSTRLNGSRFMVGWRNSTDKRMAFGVTAGLRVMVCDNMAISGEWLKFRRHTKLIEDELWELCIDTAGSLKTRLNDFGDWHKRLGTYVLRRRQAEILTFSAMEAGVIPPSKFNTFYKLFFEKGGRYNQPSLLSWYEAVTYLARRTASLPQNFSRANALTEICNGFIDRYGERI